MAVLSVLAAPAATALSVNSLWMLAAATLALLAVPGLALFYGATISRGATATMVLTFGGTAVVAILWVAYGYAMVFGRPLIPGFLGDPASDFLLGHLLGASTEGGIAPDLGSMAAACFGAVPAVIAVTIVGAAVSGRVRFRSWLVFVAVWASVVFFPVSYWVLNDADGWAAGMRADDLAGGAYVQINAASAALALVLLLRRGSDRRPIRFAAAEPVRRLPLFGVALVWIGWLALNAGAEGALDGVTALIWVNTLVAPSAGILGWLVTEKLSGHRTTTTGPAAGALSGLVAIAPACGSVAPGWAIGLGLLAAVGCALTVRWGRSLGYSGSFLVVAIHLVGGMIGMLYLGMFADTVGFIYNGNPAQFVAQAATAFGVAAYSFVLSLVIGYAIRKMMGLASSTPAQALPLRAILPVRDSR